MNTTPLSPASRPARSGRPTLAILLAIACTLLCFSLLLNCTAVDIVRRNAGGHAFGIGMAGEDEFPDFDEVLSYGTLSSNSVKVVRIPFSGVIMRTDAESGLFPRTDPVEQLLRKIRAARLDPEVSGLLLEIDSPGGAVSVVDEIHHEITRFKDSDPDRKVVVLVRDVAASGGYYIALPADAIVAQPTAIVGSIGVILQAYNLQSLAEKVGVTDVTIKSGANKDLLNPFRPVDPEQVAILQKSVDATYDRFVSLVSAARGIPEEELRASIADGRVFDAADALSCKLVDLLGYREDAIDRLAAELGADADDLCIVTYKEETGFFASLFGEMASPVDRLKAGAASLRTPRLQYLWQP